MRWRIQFGYDGSRFDGWAQQPGRRTVEGEVLHGLLAAGAVPRSTTHLEVASRTDRGVHARANAMALATDLAPRSLLRLLNGIDSAIYFRAAAPMADGERIRAALGRRYRYFDARPFRHGDRRLRAAALFTGTLDVRSLGRRLPASTPIWRTVESVTVGRWGEGSVVEVRAPAFAWGMVRRIVAALREVDDGRLPLPRLQSALEGKLRLTLPLADPEPLVLWEVEYATPWVVAWTGPIRHQLRAHAAERERAWARTQVLDSLVEIPPSGPD